MIKKVVILAAGRGTRMLHLTKDKPKPLIKVIGRPFFYYLLNNLKKAGYNQFVVVVGYKKEVMEDFAKKHKKEFNIELVNQFELCKGQYGTACPIKCVKNLIKNENFLSVSGDNFYAVKDLKEMNIDDKYNYVAGLKHKNPQRYGVLIEDKDFLKEIIEKPKHFVGDLINTGLYKFTPDIFEAIEKIKLSSRGEYELTDAISLLAKEKKVKIKRIKDYWMDFTNPADVMRMNKFLKSPRSLMDTTRVSGTRDTGSITVGGTNI